MNTTIRPDPAQDLIGALRYVMDALDDIRRERDERRIGPTAAAKTLGYCESYFRGKPWRVPNFGLQGLMHGLSAWETWNARPEIERRAEWDAMDMKTRRKAQGVA